MIPAEFEQQLIEGIQPIRHFAVAQVLHHLLRNGTLHQISERPGISTQELAEELGLHGDRLHEALRLLRNEDYLVTGEGWRLTGKGSRVLVLEPWYTLLVGGYAQTFNQLGELLKADAPFGDRDGAQVGEGSCGITMYDALPLELRLLDRVPGPMAVVDIGAGDGSALVELCRQRPGLTGIAVEPEVRSVEAARARIAEAGMSRFVEVRGGDAASVLSLRLPEDRPVCFLAAFSLQEMIEQEGVDAVRRLLKTSIEKYPEAYWLVVEVDYRPDESVLRHGLGLAYYSPYYLIHAVTEQRLETRTFWEGLFAEAGFEQLALEHADHGADSTDLLMGFLLRRAR